MNRIVPITTSEANAYLERLHRHNGALPASKFACALIDESGAVVGVAVAGLPKARGLMARDTLEINRVCTNGERNACSQLYSAVLRAGRALGYVRFVTYTLESEPGISLRASGWIEAARWEGGKWSEMRGTGHDGHDTGPKIRWEINVGEGCGVLKWPWPEKSDMPLFEDQAIGAQR